LRKFNWARNPFAVENPEIAPIPEEKNLESQKPCGDCTIYSSPLISVIIPTFNRWNYLERAISSVLNQTYLNIECIVIDDDSTTEEYKDEEKIKKIDKK